MWITDLLKGENDFSLSPDRAISMMRADKSYKLLDVRTVNEYKQGHIENAINIPNESIGHEISAQLKDKEQNIFVYCLSGHRSMQACKKLSDMGYTHVYSIGGIGSWPGKIVK